MDNDPVVQLRVIPGGKKPTMVDVARLAQVSIATVSMAMNDNPRINKATRHSVWVAAKQLNYKVNEEARALSLFRWKKIKRLGPLPASSGT